MRNSPAPSARAASKSSSGIESAYWRTRKMPNTPAAAGTITPPKLFTNPMVLSIRKSGIIATWPGITRAISNSWKTRSRPAKRSLAKA